MTRRTILGALALAILAPMASAAQTNPDTDAAIRAERAEILAEQAWLLANQRGDFEAAAIQLREAAALRTDALQRVADLMKAGHFHHYADHTFSAVAAFKDAGEAALEAGDDARAQQAFLAAARLAAEKGDRATVEALLAQTPAPAESWVAVR